MWVRLFHGGAWLDPPWGRSAVFYSKDRGPGAETGEWTGVRTQGAKLVWAKTG